MDPHPLDPSAQLIIKPSTVACPAHGEHLRAKWPRGFAAYSMTIVRAFLESPQLQAKLNGQWDPQVVNTLLTRKPMCYWVERDVIRRALMETGLGKFRRCELCRQVSIGGPYTAVIGARTTELKHVCFECALRNGDRLHAEHPEGGVWHDIEPNQ